MSHNICNTKAITDFLSSFAEGDHVLDAYLCTALKKALCKHGNNIHEINKLPDNAPTWLQEKWETGAPWHEFRPDSALKETVEHIRDWIKNAMTSQADWLNKTDEKERPLKLLKIGTLKQATAEANKAMRLDAVKWLEEFALDPEKYNNNEHRITVMLFENGYRMVQLLTREALSCEGALMGHCIGGGAYDARLLDKTHIYFSLRDSRNNPHATFEIETETNTLKQSKGKQNAIPIEKYFSFIKQFVEQAQFKLDEAPHYTGLYEQKSEGYTGFEEPQSKYYDIYSLPEGAIIKEDLDLSYLHGVRLPDDLLVKGSLYLDGADAPELSGGLKVGKHIFKVWRKKGKYHNTDGPARVICDPETLSVIEELWYKNDQYHRPSDDGPAWIKYDPATGRVREEIWYQEGKVCRENGPTIVAYDSETGEVKRHEWYQDGNRHRKNGPAFIEYDPETGEVIREQWWENGKLV